MSSITAPLEGCVKLADLEGSLIWYILGPDRHKAGAWQTDKPGCEATTHRQRELLIDGGTKSLVSPSATDPLAIEFDYAHWDPCGRFQIDVKNDVTDVMKALVIDTGVVCEGKPVVKTPTTTAPPVLIPHVEIPPVITPEVTPHANVVPEPTSMLLLGGALIARALYLRVAR